MESKHFMMIIVVFLILMAIMMIAETVENICEAKTAAELELYKFEAARADSLQAELNKYKEVKRRIDWITDYAFDSYKLAGAIYNKSIKHNLEINLLISMVKIESHFYKYAVSSADCHSYFQINATVHNIDRKRIYEEYYNAEWGCAILNDKLRQYKKLKLALNGYNGWASEKNDYANIVLKVKKKLDKFNPSNI